MANLTERFPVWSLGGDSAAVSLVLLFHFIGSFHPVGVTFCYNLGMLSKKNKSLVDSDIFILLRQYSIIWLVKTAIFHQEDVFLFLPHDYLLLVKVLKMQLLANIAIIEKNTEE